MAVDIEKLRAQIEFQYQQDIKSLDRVKVIIDSNYRRQQEMLRDLEKSLTDVNLEYIPPQSEAEDFTAPEDPGALDIEEEPALTDAGQVAETQYVEERQRVRESVKVHNPIEASLTEIRETVSELDQVLKAGRVYGTPFTAAELTASLERIGEEVEVGRVKLAVQHLVKHGVWERIQIPVEGCGTVTYYQADNAKEDIRRAVAKRRASQGVEAEPVIRQRTSTVDQPLLDSAPVKRSASDPDQKKSSQRKERR